MSRCHGNHRQTLFAHFRQVLHASAQYDQAITVFHRLKKRLKVSNLCSLSWDQTVTFSDLAHGLVVEKELTASVKVENSHAVPVVAS